MRQNLPRLFECSFRWLCSAVALISLGGCGTGTIIGDHEKECTITRCADLNMDCGEVIVDGCGVIRCGDCQPPESCGGGGTPNVCGAEPCQPSWECEQPLNGYETGGCGERRPNPACAASSPCGNGVMDPGEACDSKDNIGCSGSTPVCEPDCSGCTRGNEDCTKTRCPELGKNCGEIEVDGCGVIQCGECEAPETCGGGGTPDVCGVDDCKPSWECEQPLNGNEKDGCGNRRPNPACDASTTKGLLWDGSFKPTWYRVSKTNINSGGIYDTACLAQPESFSVVNASTLQGGRQGYVGKFFSGVGSAYECNSNRHNIIVARDPKIPGPTGIREIWYGWSTYLPTGFDEGGSLSSCLGLCLSSVPFLTGYGLYINNYANSWKMSMVLGQSDVNYVYSNEDMANKWFDYAYHVKWATDTTGFLELWLRKPGQATYSRIFARNNIRTEYLPSGTTPTNHYYEIRVGQYSNLSNAKKPQTVYVMNPKIGTTLESVEFR